MRRLPLLTAGLLLAVPSVAAAATVRTGESCPPRGPCFTTAAFEAAAGEANDVTVTATPGGFRFADAGAPVAAGTGCTQADPRTVECRAAAATVAAGDAADRVTGPAVVHLGPGDDRTTGVTVAFGEDGDDALVGGDGADHLDGGAGRDDVAAGGGDDSVEGGAGDDVLDGGGGDDAVDGGAGDDLLAKYAGTGVLHGGAGDDRLDAGAAARRLRMACGAGRDAVSPNTLSSVAGDCEALTIGDSLDGRLALPLRLRGGSVATTVREERGERGRLVVRDARTERVLGAARFRGRGYGVPVRVRVALPPAAARRARRAGRLAIRLDALDVKPPRVAVRARLTVTAGGAPRA
jgi:hypothetical protein